MADDNGVPEKGAGPWGQAITAVALVAALVVGLWAFAKPSSSQSGQSPARCRGGEAEKASGKPGKGPDVVSGAQLCEALNRPDLARLLGTPQESAKSASGGGGSVRLAGGEEIPNPSARVEFGTYTVSLSESYDRLPVSRAAALLGDGAGKRTVLGRSAVLYADRTISLSFRLDGSDSHSGPGYRPALSPWPGTRRTAVAPSTSPCGAPTAWFRTTRCSCASPRRYSRPFRGGPPTSDGPCGDPLSGAPTAPGRRSAGHRAGPIAESGPVTEPDRQPGSPQGLSSRPRRPAPGGGRHRGPALS